jgi:sec-independent protein translocase protein TatC
MAPLSTKDKDLFEGTTMTFGEHLEELRRCLMKALLGLVIAFLIALPPLDLASKMVDYVKGPLEDALQDFYLTRSERYVTEKLAGLKSAGVATPPLDEVQEAILVDRMLPNLVFIDPRNVFNELKKSYPQQFEHFGLPAFGSVDIVNPERFCEQLYEEREQSPGPAHRVWELLSPEGRALVEKYKDGYTPVTPEDRFKLAEALLKVIESPDFYQEDAFASLGQTAPSFVLTESDQRRQIAYTKYHALMARKDNLSALELNRGLLSAAFPLSLSTGVRQASMLPLLEWKAVDEDPRTSLRSLSAQEMFFIYVKAALIVALIIASPWVFLQIWNFVAAGLYPHERRYVYLFLPISLGLFLGGVLLAFFFVFKPVLDFLLMFNDWMDVDPDVRISEWFGFAIFLPVGFGVAFQLPLAMLLLERIGIIQIDMYTKNWRIAVLAIFIISMFLTPADPYSMLLMAVPLTILYGGGILMCKYLPRGRNPFDSPDEID